MLLHPQEIDIPLPDGGTKKFLISKFPAIAGREIVTQYPISAVPKLGDYGRNQELLFKLMAYVAVPMPNGNAPLQLTTQALIDSHVPDFETLMRIEMAMMELNCSFFRQGKASSFFETLGVKVQALITQTLTDFSDRYSKKG
jgi:hypothetical protein